MAVGRKTGGRQKGTPNKSSAALKDAILNAFEEVGGQSYLVTVANEDPKTFCVLLGKVLPTQLTGENGGPIQTEDVTMLTPEEKSQRLARLIGSMALH